MLSSRRFFAFLLASVAFHLLISVATYLVNKTQPISTEAITIEITDSTPQLTTAKPKIQKNQKTEKLDKQIVEQDEKSRNEEVPNDTRFLSAKNQKVEKQTVATHHGEFRNLKKESKETDVSAKPGKKLSFAEITPKLGRVKAYDPSAAREEAVQDPSEAQPESGGAEASATNDYLKDVDQGLETLLNAREFKYYTYYNRIRRQLSQHWEPKVRTKLSQMFKQGRYLAAATDRITKLVVVLDTKGNLVKVQMLKDSGVTDLDDAAVEAFQSAAPFPNPPKGIVEPDGTVKIRWDFVLET